MISLIRRYRSLFAFSVAWSMGGADPQLAAAQVKVEAVAGDQVVVKYAAGQEPQAVRAGEEIEVWSSLQTGPQSAVRIQYPDGSILIVGRNTKFTLLPKQAGTQFSELNWGIVRTLVPPSSKTASKKAVAPKFLIRTKTAVLGVRGTEFFAQFDDRTRETTLHTIRGVVGISRFEDTVLKDRAITVPEGRRVSVQESTPSDSVLQPSRFGLQAFGDEWNGREPELMSLAPPDWWTPTPVTPAEGDQLEVQTRGAPSAGLVPTEKVDVKSASEPVVTENDFQWLQFRVAGVWISQGSLGQVFTGAVSYDPEVRIWNRLWIRGHVSLFGIKSGNQSSVIPAGRLALGPSLDAFWGFKVESLMGYEHWLSSDYDDVKSFVYGGGLAWKPKSLGFLDRFFIQYLRLSSSTLTQETVSQLHLGMGLRF